MMVWFDVPLEWVERIIITPSGELLEVSERKKNPRSTIYKLRPWFSIVIVEEWCGESQVALSEVKLKS